MIRVSPAIIAYLLSITPLQGAGYWHGTAGAVVTTSDSIIAAIDSKEVNREYLNDGTLIAGNRVACKVRQAGPFYVMIAGISRATGGFNALQAVSAAHHSGDTLKEFASRLEDELPIQLAGALNAVATVDRSFLGQDVLQLALLGAEYGSPQAIILSFTASEPTAGRIAIRPHRTTNPEAVHLLGMHTEAERYLAQNPQQTPDALQLIGLEYASHPEFVGGPATLLRATSGGIVMEQPGACTAGEQFPEITAQLDEAIAGVDNVVVREDVSQYSRRGGKLRKGALQTTVRVIGGVEDYGWDGRLPEPWCGGELSTMMRVTRLAISNGRSDLSVDEDAIVMRFHATEADRYWQLMIGAQTHPLAFDGAAWFSKTGKLLRIRWEASDPRVPSTSGIARIEWDESFVTGDITGKPMLMPETALYRVTYAKHIARIDWTETHFSGFRRFGSTQSVQFEEAAIRPGVPSGQ